MKSALEAIRARALERLQNAEDLTALEEARVQLLGKKGELTAILKSMGQLSPEERPAMGQMANEVRAAIEEKLAARGRLLVDEGHVQPAGARGAGGGESGGSGSDDDEIHVSVHYSASPAS